MQRPFRRLGEVLRPKQAKIKYRQIARLKTLGSDIVAFLRNYVTVHQSLVALTAFILVSNAIVVHAANVSTLTPTDAGPLDPYKVADTVRIIAPYMTDVQQDPDAIASALEEKVNGNFITTNTLIATLPGESDEPDVLATPSSQAATSSSGGRTSNINYTVEIGDTLSGISNAFGLHADTVRVKNNLSDADSIKPGQVLIIPPQDLSDQAIAAADNRQKASTGAGTTTIASAKRAGGYGFIVPIHYTVIARRLEAGHTGIDYDAPIGTPVYAAADGVVISSMGGWNGGFGNNVLVNIGSNMTLRYAHLSSYVVSSGQTVKQGQLIAYSGNTGRSTGPHLHFELRVNGIALDPGT